MFAEFTGLNHVLPNVKVLKRVEKEEEGRKGGKEKGKKGERKGEGGGGGKKRETSDTNLQVERRKR